MYVNKWIKKYVSKETVVLRRWESIARNLVLTTELKISKLVGLKWTPD